MSYVTRPVAHCDLCGHEWLVIAEKTPTHCARCRQRRWNTEPPTAPGTAATLSRKLKKPAQEPQPQKEQP